jgi:hypothetical protein
MQFQISITAKNPPGPVYRRTYDGNYLLNVRDLNTQATFQIRVEDVSPYRHMLIQGHTEFRVLDVVPAQLHSESLGPSARRVTC